MRTLKCLIATAAVFCFVLLLTSCDEETILKPEELNPPLGLFSVTGDGEVDLIWFTSNFESDLDGYAVYIYEGDYASYTSRSEIPSGFSQVGRLPVTTSSSGTKSLTVTDLDYGQTYSFLVVAAQDDWSKFSHTSNIVIDTPRPEVTSLELRDENLGQGDCALKFSSTAPYVEVVDKTDPAAVIMFESFNAGLGKRSGLVGVSGRAQIQDLGYMTDWYLADVAPTDGYPASDFSVTAIEHHVYAVKVTTMPPSYAKIYVQSITGNPANNSDVATVWVAYQTDPNNPELAPGPN